MSFNLDFANNTILSCFFFFFLIIGLIPAVIVQINQLYNLTVQFIVQFNPIIELVIPIGIPTKKTKAEMETHPLIVEITISKGSI